MRNRRLKSAKALAVGVFVSAAATLLGMLLMAAAVIFLGMGDTPIRAMNQALKVLAVALGVYLAVGRGGERGLVTGAGVGMVYAAVGYVMYICLGGASFNVAELLGEILIAVAAGAAAGAVCANLHKPKMMA